MTLTKNQILAVVLTAILLLVLPLAVILTQKRQDIRPKAQVPATSPISPTPGIACLTLPTFDTFDAANLNTDLWNFWTDRNGVVTQSGGQLRTSAGTSAGPSHGGVITKNKVCGDFDVNVDVSQFTSSLGNNAAAVLSVEQIESDSAVYIQLHNSGQSQGFETDERLNRVWRNLWKEAKSTVTAGKLRIRRQGSVFSVYYDTKDGSGWKLLQVYNTGFNTDVNILIGVGSWDPDQPSVSANFDNFNLTEAVLDPSITLVPPTPTWSPTPTPPSGREKYTIDIGDKQSLVFQIGPAINPQIKFKAKLASLSNTPDLYLRLRIKDELAFMSSQNYQSASTDTCNEPNLPDRDFYVPMKAVDGVYIPVQQITSPPPTGATVATVNPDGWVILDGVIPGRYYTLLLKGPKTRKGKMVEHFLLQPNQTSQQNFDWTGRPLDPGDLPNPDKDMKQDCTINSTDWSLVKKYIGSNKTDAKALDVADVNYSGEVNALDSINILSTLAKRPDDDQ